MAYFHFEMPCNTEEEEVEEEEDGGYDYEFIKPGPPNIYFCLICHLVARNAHQTSCCGKIFCAVCIERLNQSGYQIKCTLCRQDFNYFKDIRTIREIKSLKIYCTNHSNGCDWDGDLEKIQEHIKTCSYEYIECENNCEEKVQRRLSKTHLTNECPNRRVPCIECKEIGTYVYITGDHYDVCPDLLLPCSITGCREQVKRRNVNSHEEICPKRIVPCPYVLEFKNEDIAKHHWC